VASPRSLHLGSAFEVGEDGWTHASLGAEDTWHRAAASCDGAFPLTDTAFVSNGNNVGPACAPSIGWERSRLLGPPILLPAAGPIRLSFDARAYDEGGGCVADAAFDSKDVGITTDGGATYTRLNDCAEPLTPVLNTAIVHWTFDISAFAGQTVQVIFVYDTVDDFQGSYFAVDNVRVEAQDFDGDGSGDACDSDDDQDGRDDSSDCAPFDGTTWSLPGEVTGLGVALPGPGGSAQMDWTAPAGGLASSMTYDVIRSTNRADYLNPGFATCLESDDGPNTTAGDSAPPALGTGYFYQIVARHVCGRGSAGTTSNGTPRAMRDCPAPCISGADCAAGYFCNAVNQCEARKSNGSACAGGGECISGFCADGFCCNTPCGASCDACNLAGSLGSCTVVPAGSAGNPSCAPDVCSGTSPNCP
jgi:hypothetical protein